MIGKTFNTTAEMYSPTVRRLKVNGIFKVNIVDTVTVGLNVGTVKEK